MDGLTSMTILGVTAADLLSRIIYLGVVVIIALVVQRALVRGMHKALDRSNLPSATIFINIMRGLLWTLVLLVVMQPVFGVSPTGFVAALGVGSVVISFGLQETVSNIVSGLGLMLGKVVQPGDEVTIGTFTGTVTDVTWRHTIVSKRNGTKQVIPNSVLNTAALTRRTAWDAGDCALVLYVRRDAQLDAVEADVIEAGTRVLADTLDPAIATSVVFDQIRPDCLVATAHFHLKDEQIVATARDLMVRELANRSWMVLEAFQPAVDARSKGD